MARDPESTSAKNAEKQHNNPIADSVELAGTAIDLSDVAVAACRKTIQALEPRHRTGGNAGSTGFATGGSEGAGESFATGTDCLPESLDLVDAGDTAVGILDGIGSVVGGIFDGLGSL